MIVVEGLDNTGKTTLVEKLCSDFPQLKHTPSIGNKHDLNQIADQAWYMAEEAEVDEIWDRSRIISEYVYNPVLNMRPLAFNKDSWFEMIRRWLQHPQLVIYCRRPIGHIFESFDEREQLEGVAGNLAALDRAYEGMMWFIEVLFQQSDPPKYIIEYNYEVDTYEEVRDSVARYLAEAKELVR